MGVLFVGSGGAVCLLHMLFSVRHVCIHVCSCHHAAYINTGVTLPVEPERMCVRVSVLNVCLSVAQLWNWLILTSEAASTSLPAPPPASLW